jgi:hypothetical protein
MEKGGAEMRAARDMEGEEYGWADGARVPLARAASVAWEGWLPEEGLDGVEDAEGGGGWWPSESVRSLWLEWLSRGQAAEISAMARQELVYWLAGEGLHPVRWLRRWTAALARWDRGAVPGSVSAAMFGSPATWERVALGGLFPGSSARVASRRLESVWRGLGSRCAVRGAGERVPLEALVSGSRALGWCAPGGWPEGGPEEAEAEAEAAGVSALSMGGLVRWIGQEGTWGLPALKRFYVLVFVRYRDLAPGMTGRDFGAIYGQTRAAFCEDAKRFVGLPLERELGWRPKVAGQKSAAAAASYAANAARHCPRRQAGPVSEGAAEEEAERGDAALRLREAREAAARRDLERDARAMEELARRNRGRRRDDEVRGRQPSANENNYDGNGASLD